MYALVPASGSPRVPGAGRVSLQVGAGADVCGSALRTGSASEHVAAHVPRSSPLPK